MNRLLVVSLALASGSLLFAQERRDVPRDSERISITGCAKGRRFIVGPRSDHEPVRSDVAPGRRFRLAGPKKLLKEIKQHEGSMIDVTGLVRKSQLNPPQGVSIAGGRVRIGGGVPRDPLTDTRHDPGYNEVVLDVESWSPLAESCPKG